MENTHILGYTRLPDGSWEPVHECKPGYIYSAAVVCCRQCGRMLRGMGGPLNAVCTTCFEKVK